MNYQQPKIIRKPDVIKMAGFSKSTLYNRIQQGLWPKPISLGFRAVGFIQAECEAVLNAMISEQSPEQIKQLVSELIKQRKQVA
tara:strand:+ start:2467 stop:2718 length:252 start_codon:yes stop_codon:yes gene_type:complete